MKLTDNNQSHIDNLIRYLSNVHSKVERKGFASRFLFSLSVTIVLFTAWIWLEHWFYLSSIQKMVLAGISIGAGVLAFYSLSAFYTSNSFSSFYKAFSSKTELPALKYAFDLKIHARDRHLKLYETALQQHLDTLSRENIQSKLREFTRQLPETTLFRRSIASFLGVLLLLVLTGGFHTDALVRSAVLWKSFQKPNPYTFTVTPGSATIEQGSSFRPEVTFKGTVPGELLLTIKTDVEEQFRFRPFQKTEEGSFRTDPISLSTDATYFVRMDGFQSDFFDVDVQLRPRFESLSVDVIPPSYTKLDSTQYRYPFSLVKAYEGSEIRISGITNKPVQTLSLVSEISGDTLTGSKNEPSRNFSFNLKATRPDTLRFNMSDRSGLNNSNPFEFTLEPIKDEYPFVQILQPENNLELSNPETIDVTFEAADDFGITKASLHYELRRAFVDEPAKGTITLDRPVTNRSRTFQWDLRELGPKPRDTIVFWIRVQDNDGHNGYKTSDSRRVTVTFPSLVENMDALEEKESNVRESLEDISESYEKMKEEYDRFKENLKENPETSWEQQQMLEDVRRQQEDIDKKVDELNRKFEEIRKEINQSDHISEETRQAYEELEKLIEEIDDPELMKALEELQKSLGNLSRQELRKALENFEFNEQNYRERLNRTLELFKSLKLNSDLEKLATALEDLAKKEEELSKSGQPPSEQAEQQEAIRDDTEKVSEQLEELDRDAPERNRENVRKLREESQKELESIKEQLEKNIKELREQGERNKEQGGESSPHQQQQQIRQEFNRLAQKMRQAKQQFNRQRMQVNMGALQNILYSLINISEEQEDLTQNTEHLADRSQAFVEKARVEKNISRQFSKIADSMFAVSSQIPRFSNRINEKKQVVERDLGQAVEQLAERNKSQSTYAQRQSLGGINELASMVASLMDQLQQQAQGGMGGGMSMQQFMEQLKNMSGAQQQLNRRIQNLINDIQGNRLTKDQIDRLNQMARQQNEIRKQLREMQRNGELQPGDKILSELERMAEEMEETINDLRGGQTDRLLIERQQNILSRMLNAEKALQERDKKDEREGTTPEDAPDAVSPNVTLEELQKKIRNLLNDPENTRFSEDYQRLIEQYFELLKQLREKESS